MRRRARSDAYLHFHIRTCPFAHPYANADCYRCSHTHTRPVAYPYRYGDTRTCLYRYAVTDAHAYGDAYAYPYIHPYFHTHAYADCYAVSFAYSYGYAAAPRRPSPAGTGDVPGGPHAQGHDIRWRGGVGCQ